MAHRSLRHWLYVRLDPGAWHRKGLSPLNRFFVAFIALAVFCAVI